MENEKYLASILDDSVITCDEVVKKLFGKTSMKIKQPVKHKISLAFLLITIPLLMAVSIYCYLTKHQAK